MLKWILRTLAVVIGLPLVLLSVEVGGRYLVGYPPIARLFLHKLPFMGERFTPKKWREGGSCAGLSDAKCAEKESNCPRGRMVYDLTEIHLVVGETSRLEVEYLLGAPDRLFRRDRQQCLRYHVGMCSGLGIDYDSLFVCFDDTGLVSSAGHQQH